ncbi:MAG TPA: hypothetical protein DD979_00190 [Gammaproteobacteria bacterium]|nr:hypothetical protein [Gammaproteobacteria bacterium]
MSKTDSTSSASPSDRGAESSTSTDDRGTASASSERSFDAAMKDDDNTSDRDNASRSDDDNAGRDSATDTPAASADADSGSAAPEVGPDAATSHSLDEPDDSLDPESTTAPAPQDTSAPTAEQIARDAALKTAAPVQDGLTALTAPEQAIAQLNSPGDTVTLRAVAEVKGNIQVGVKGQLGAEITVQQQGTGPQTRYTVSLEKQSLAAVTANVSLPYAPVKLEQGLQTADRVEMTFATRQDAVRATEIVQGLVVADAISDATPGLSGGVNPVANPLMTSGAPGDKALTMAGPTPADLEFLQNNITAYETTLGSRARAALEIQAPQLFQPFQAQAELRVDPRMQVTRHVELPTATEPGQLVYTAAGDVRLSAKEKVAIDALPTNQFDAAVLAQNRIEAGLARLEVSAHYALPTDEVTHSALTDRPIPEYDLVTQDAFGMPDRFSITATTQHRTQGLLDLSRGDRQRTRTQFEITDPRQAATAMSHLANGDAQAAADAVGATLTTETHQVRRTGFDVQGGVRIKALEGNDIEATLIVEAGIDDVTVVDDVPQAQPPAQTRSPRETLVVVPERGLTVRDAPVGAQTSVFRHGTFVQKTGNAITAIDGSRWVPVNGLDVNNQPVSGYVFEDFVQTHDPRQGAMDATGRRNPALDQQRYTAVTVQPGDNLWDLANAHGVDVDEMVALNRDHMISPEQIYTGDTVYVPGTAQGPEHTPAPIVDTTPPTQPLPPEVDTPYAPVAPTPGYTPQQAPTPIETPLAPDAVMPMAPTVQTGRQPLAEILAQYQVPEDTMVNWTPKLGPFTSIELPFVNERTMTQTEAELLDALGSRHGLWGLKAFSDIVSPGGTDRERNAYRVADQHFPRNGANNQPIPGAEDGHNDAMRHAFFNAALTEAFGVEFANDFGTAHEGVVNNPAAREAMDLYNNALGRRIATENPEASLPELADLIRDAIIRGEAVVINSHGELMYSDQVAVGQTGRAQ